MDSRLSIYILTQIIRCIHDDIDKLCLILTCKRMFQLRRVITFRVFDERLVPFISFPHQQEHTTSLRLFTSPNLYQQPPYVHIQEDANNNNPYSLDNMYPTQDRMKLDNSSNSIPVESDIKHHITHLLIRGGMIGPTLIPSTITHLRLGYIPTGSLHSGMIPSSVSHLHMGRDFNESIQPGVLPPSITHLFFGDRYDSPILVGSMPASITHIKFDYFYNQMIQHGALPPNLHNLAFGRRYNQPLAPGVLPASLSKLVFGYVFNSQLQIGSLPPNLHHIRFGMRYDRPLGVGVLPDTLTHIFFSFQFNQPLTEGVLPLTTTHLFFGASFNSPLYLPPNVTHLVMGANFQHSSLINISRQLHDLSMMYDPIAVTDSIPPSVTHLTLFIDFDRPSHNDIEGIVQSVPKTITHLCITTNYNHPLPCILNPVFIAQETKFNEWFSQPRTRKMIRVANYKKPGEGPFVHLSLSEQMPPNSLPPCVDSLSLDRQLRDKSGKLSTGFLPSSIRDFGCFADHHKLPLSAILPNVNRFSITSTLASKTANQSTTSLLSVTFYIRLISPTWLLVVANMNGVGGFININQNTLNLNIISFLSSIMNQMKESLYLFE